MDVEITARSAGVVVGRIVMRCVAKRGRLYPAGKIRMQMLADSNEGLTFHGYFPDLDLWSEFQQTYQGKITKGNWIMFDLAGPILTVQIIGNGDSPNEVDEHERRAG